MKEVGNQKAITDKTQESREKNGGGNDGGRRENGVLLAFEKFLTVFEKVGDHNLLDWLNSRKIEITGTNGGRK